MLRTRTDLTTQTVFSMTFFDWSGSNGKTQVSSYLWVYIVVTVVFTALTIGLWYYFVIHRRTSRKPIEEQRC
jgi:heme/copper-type cytochrome/quinol oxidase subunit 2